MVLIQALQQKYAKVQRQKRTGTCGGTNIDNLNAIAMLYLDKHGKGKDYDIK